MYKIYDTHDRVYLPRTYKTRSQASKRADKLDLEYGAVRFVVVPWTWLGIDLKPEHIKLLSS